MGTSVRYGRVVGLDWERLPIGTWFGFNNRGGVAASVNWYGIPHWRRDPDGYTRLGHETHYWVAWIHGRPEVCLGLDHKTWTTPQQAMAAADAHLASTT